MSEDNNIYGELAKVRAERDELRRDNERLRQLLSQTEPLKSDQPIIETGDPKATNTIPGLTLTPDEKIKLFRSLFHGRDDVYAIRWESKIGKSGYSPARIYRPIPNGAKRKQVDQEDLLPLTDSVVRDHLTGKITVGIYPILSDDSCYLLASDFDKSSWQEDAGAFLNSCRELGVPALLERSRSGNGAHVWIFFEEPISASLARKLGCYILTRTLERRHLLGLDSYDRFFPNQDTLPKGGFGNLIALPLQGRSRSDGNSVFLDDQLEPCPDQWETLSSINRIKSADVERIVRDAVKKGQVLGATGYEVNDEISETPWTIPPSGIKLSEAILGPFPDSVQVVMANLVYVEKENLSPSLLNRLNRLAAFQNPAFYKSQAMRLSTWDKPRIICCSEDFPKHIAVPRGCLKETIELLDRCGIKCNLLDQRNAGDPVDLSFHGSLQKEQEVAARSALAHTNGMISAPTAFGKTVIGAWIIAERKVNTLVLVHRKPLMDQWRAQLANFLQIPLKEIGQIGGGRVSRTGKIDVAMIQSLNRKGIVKDFVAEYGQVVVDECHHVSAFSFEQVLRKANARFVLGITATPVRQDGHHPIIAMQCGPIRYKGSEKQGESARPQRDLVVRSTAFVVPPRSEEDYAIQEIYSALVANVERNQFILSDLVGSILDGRCPLLLTERREHLDWFASNLHSTKELSELGRPLRILKLHGSMKKKQLSEMSKTLGDVQDAESLVILATGRYIGEGFDVARLDTLFLASPFSWRGTLQQYVGRLHRLSPNKESVRVYDYVDIQVGVLAAMFRKRMAGYKALGYHSGIDEVGITNPTDVPRLWT